MNDLTDNQLLADYAERRSETAFAELVRRHVDLVHSAALRMVCDTHSAQDVTQGVFLALAQNAGKLVNHSILSGWLHCTTRNLAANAVRADVRRRVREQEAAAMNELLSAEPDITWEQIAPHLDNALGELSEPDRDAVLLRYFEHKSAHEMAQSLGVSDEAAQKRVSRAVERLRELFTKRGVTVGTSGLVVVVTANAVQAAPVGLAVTISTAATLAGATFATTATATATKAIAMTTLQKTFLTASIAILAGTGIYEARQAANARAEIQTLKQLQAPLAEQFQQLQRERDDCASKLAERRDDNERLNRNSAELLRLRGEVARLREDSRKLTQMNAGNATNENDSLESAMKLQVARVKKLKQRLEEMPERKIPELEFLTGEDWIQLGTGYFEDERGSNIQRVLADLRRVAKTYFANMAGHALDEYILINDGKLPDELSQLKPYFTAPPRDTMLERYKLLRKGQLAALPESEPIISERAVVDDREDTLFTIGAYGWTWRGTGMLTTGAIDGTWDTSRIKAFMKK